MTLTGTYIYSPTKEDLKFQDTGWLPQDIDMLALVDQYDKWIDDGMESDWWGTLHSDSHPETCTNCIDVNIYTEDSIIEEDYQGGDLENGYGDVVTVTLYPVHWEDGSWHVDTQQWFDITDYLKSTICVECGEYKPDDDRVFGGLKCGECAYS